jgi:hypothetical protein
LKGDLCSGGLDAKEMIIVLLAARLMDLTNSIVNYWEK